MYDENNIFAKILRKEIPCEAVYEDDQVLFFYDINPQAKVHILGIPKKNVVDLADFILRCKSRSPPFSHSYLGWRELKRNQINYSFITT